MDAADDEQDVGVAGGRPRRRLVTAGLVVGMVVLLASVPACSSSSPPSSLSISTTTTSTTSGVVFPQGLTAEVAACQADAQTLEVALQAYMAEKGSYPTPPAAWSAATYAANYAPLTSGGAFLHSAPGDKDYVIEYDSAGHVWVAPPGSYGPTFNPGQSFDANQDICEAAVR